MKTSTFIVKTPQRWTMIDVKKKIENLEMRMLKAKRFSYIIHRTTAQPNEKINISRTKLQNTNNENQAKSQQNYLKIARKFITFWNSICILFIQHGLKQEAFELLKKWSYLDVEIFEADPPRWKRWKGHILYNLILCHYFGKSAFAVKTLLYLQELSEWLDETRTRNCDFICSINFFFFYICWKTK